MSLKLHTLLRSVQAVFFSLINVLANGQATIQTDKLDYKPGDTVIITGAGWGAGEIVSLQLDEIPDLTSCESHNVTAVANANGELYNKKFLISEGHVGVIFQLTATGETSGMTAASSFTDAAKTWVGTGSPAPVPGASSDFNNPANWEPYGVPGPADDVSINITKSVTIALNADVVIKSLAFNVMTSSVAGLLDVFHSRLTILNTSAIAITALPAKLGNALRVGVIDMKGTGVVDFRGDVTISSTSDIYRAEFSGNGSNKLIFRGNLNLEPGSGININKPGTWEFDGAGEQIITWNNTRGAVSFKNLIIGNEHSPTIKMAGKNDPANNIQGNLTLNNSSIFDLGPYRCNHQGIGGTLTLNGFSILKLGAIQNSNPVDGKNYFMNFDNFYFSPTSWIEYNAAGQTPQIIYHNPPYANLRLLNGVKSTIGHVTVKGVLQIDGDAVLTPGISHIVSGTGKLTGTGTVQVTRILTTPDFNSQYTIANKDLSQLTVEYKGNGPQQISALNYGNLTITEAGTRTVAFPTTGIVAVTGTLSLAATNTSYSVAGSTINFNGSDQVIPPFDYNNLVLSGIGKKTLQGTTTVKGALSVNKDAVLSLNNQLLNVYSNWFNEGAIDPGTGVSGVYFKDNTVLSGSPVILNNAFVDGTLSLFTDLTVTNNFTLGTNGKFNPNSSHVRWQGDLFLYGVWNTPDGGNTASFEGNKLQVIHGIGGIVAFQNFKMNNSLGVLLDNTSLNINGLLSLDDGVISAGANTIMVTSTGLISGGSPASYIDGKLSQVFHTTGARTFPVGRGGEFSPLVFNYTTLDAPSTVVVEQFPAGFPGALPKGTALLSSRYWNVSQSGAGTYKYAITFDKPETVPLRGMVVLKHEAGLTDSYPADVPNYTVAGLVSLGDFALAEINVLPTTTIASNTLATYGDMAVDLLATVSPGTASGDVEFFVDGNSIGRAVLSAGIAKLSIDMLNIPVGKHTIRAFYLGDNTHDVSTSDPVSNGELIINALAIEVTAKTQSKVYGEVDPRLTFDITKGRLVDNDQFTGELVRAPGQDVGEYIIGRGTLVLSNNYNLEYVGANFFITPRNIEVTADAKSKVYGENDPALTYRITGGTMAFQDAFTGTLMREEGESVGQYEIRQGSLVLNSNYDIRFKNAPFTIDKRSITVTASPQGKVYGSVDPTLTYKVTSGGLAGEDGFCGTLSRAAGEDVGSYLINQGTFTAGDNYELRFITSSLTITPAPATIHISDVNRTYNGNTQGVTVRTMPEDISVVVTYNGDVTIPVNAGSYAVEVVLINSNYKLVDEQGANLLEQTGTLVIGPRTLNIAVNHKSKVYGTDNPVLDGTESGLVSSDGISVAYETKAQTNSDVGEYAINAILKDPNSKLGNYSVVKAEGKLTITPAPATIWVTDLSKTYNGQPQAVTITTSPAGLAVNVTYAGSANTPINAGSYAVVAALNNPNYSATYGTFTMIIDKADAAFHIEGYDGVYDGDAHQASGSASGVMGEDLSNLLTFEAGITNVPGGEVSWSFKGNENYKAAGGTRAIVLSKADPVVTAYGEVFMYDGSPHPGYGTAKGVQNEDLVPGVTISYAGTLNNGTTYSSPDAPVEAGIYTVTASFAGNDNYKIGTASVPLRIYAVPIVSLTSPLPVEINTPAITTVNLQGEVFNAKWNYSSGATNKFEQIMNKVPDGDKEKLIAGQLTVISSTVGVYTITLSYENGVGAQFTTTIPAYAVFYDPSAGFVTGGGWIHSPEGAYTVDKSLAGKATFGFVSKYEKGRTVPSGNTEFQFHAAKMNFRSTAYEYLIVAGSRAQYKGVGTINGTGNYGFMLTGVDGEKDGVGKPDLFRIRIWDKNAGDIIVYDNESGIADDAAITTELGGGSIVIHIPPGGGKKSNIVSGEAKTTEVIEPAAEEFRLKVFPNPTISSFNVQVKSDGAEEKISLRVVDLNGRTIEMVNNASPGQTYSLGANYRPGVYLVEMIQGSRRSQAMLLKVAE